MGFIQGMENIRLKKMDMGFWIYSLSWIYLVLPTLFFIVGWCKWYFSLPAAALMLWSLYRVIIHRPHWDVHFEKKEYTVFLAAIVIIFAWVVMSGVGDYMFQNSDHATRDAIMEAMTDYKWPMRQVVPIEGGGTEERSLVYYIGYWMVPTAVAKLFGTRYVYETTFLWTVLGILLMYGVICVHKKKVMIWPLLFMIFFAGLDVFGLNFYSWEGDIGLLGNSSIEFWTHDLQFTSMTTQLFWVYNQSVPAWLATALLIEDEKPENIFYLIGTLGLSSTFAAVGMVPFGVYFAIDRTRNEEGFSSWTDGYRKVCRRIFSPQNVFGGGVTIFFPMMYMLTNNIFEELLVPILTRPIMGIPLFIWGIVSVVILFAAMFGFFVYMDHHSKVKEIFCQSGYFWITLVVVGYLYHLMFDREWAPFSMWWFMKSIVFLIFEVAAYFLLVKRYVRPSLWWLNLIVLFACTQLKLGSTLEICMRSSIPGLFILMVWAMDHMHFRSEIKVERIMACGLLMVFILGAFTPLREIGRTYANTDMRFKSVWIDEEHVFYSGYHCGRVNSGFFWKYMAKDAKE